MLKQGLQALVNEQSISSRCLSREHTVGGGKYHCMYGLQVYKIRFNCFTRYMQNCIFSLLVKSSLVKLETSCPVILPPIVSVLWSKAVINLTEKIFKRLFISFRRSNIFYERHRTTSHDDDDYDA